jgi:hypothetical protein
LRAGRWRRRGRRLLERRRRRREQLRRRLRVLRRLAEQLRAVVGVDERWCVRVIHGLWQSLDAAESAEGKPMVRELSGRGPIRRIVMTLKPIFKNPNTLLCRSWPNLLEDAIIALDLKTEYARIRISSKIRARDVI